MSAVPRPNWTPPEESGTDALAQWMTEQLRRDPSYQLPEGYSVDQMGQVTRDKNWLWQNPWVFPAAGVGAGLFGGALAGTGPLGGGGAAAGGAGMSEAAIPSMVGIAPSAAGGASWLGPALALGTGVAGRLMNRGGGSNMIQPPPQLDQLLQEATRRTMNQAPLSDAITRQALAGLPNYARG